MLEQHCDRALVLHDPSDEDAPRMVFGKLVVSDDFVNYVAPYVLCQSASTAADADEPAAEPSTHSSGSHTSEEACAEPGCLDRVVYWLQ